jgi:hypothetical protein
VATSDPYSQVEVLHQVKSILCVFHARESTLCSNHTTIIRPRAVATTGIFEKTRKNLSNEGSQIPIIACCVFLVYRSIVSVRPLKGSHLVPVPQLLMRV